MAIKLPKYQRQVGTSAEAGGQRGDISSAGSEWRDIGKIGSQVMGIAQEVVDVRAKVKEKTDRIGNVTADAQRASRLKTFDTLSRKAISEFAQQKGSTPTDAEVFAVNQDLRDVLDEDLAVIYEQVADEAQLAQYQALDGERNGTAGIVADRAFYDLENTRFKIASLETEGANMIVDHNFEGANAMLEAVKDDIGGTRYLEMKNKFQDIHNTTFINSHASAETITGLKDSYKQIEKDPTVPDWVKKDAESKNKRAQTAMLALKDDQNKDNYAEMNLQIYTGAVTQEQVIESFEKSKTWDGPNDDAGINITQTASALLQIDNQEAEKERLLEKEEREAATLLRTEQNEKDAVMRIEIADDEIGLKELEEARANGTIRDNQYYARRDQLQQKQARERTAQELGLVTPLIKEMGNVKAGELLGAEIILDEFNTKIMNSTLTSKHKADMLRAGSRVYLQNQKNPTTAPQVREAVAKLMRYSANAVELGVSDDLTGNVMDFMDSFSEGATSEVIKTNLDVQIDSMQGLIEKITLKRIQANNPTEKTEIKQGGYIVGNLYEDANGNKAVWNGKKFEAQ